MPPVDHAAKRRASRSPWGLSPFCGTPGARERWDWSGARKRLDDINRKRAAAGLPPVDPPKDTPQ